MNEFECPQAGNVPELHSVQKREDGLYVCICGCVYFFHYGEKLIMTDGSKLPPALTGESENV